jgi:Ca-activated chloride channel family protein
LASLSSTKDRRAGRRLIEGRVHGPAFSVLGALLCLLLLLLVSSISAQSGRNKSQTPTSPVKSPANGAARSSPQGPGSPSPSATPLPQASATTGAKIVMDEPPPPPPTSQSPPEVIDPSDVVRINSNLVTVPTSVVDPTGRAVVDLKLEDFELRIDGQPKPISDLGRSESPVRMAMLFDNSDSLQAARDFEKKAAVRFFRSVMRPIDQAAIYSVATESFLAQPMTSDVHTLIRTIESFGKPDGATALFDGVIMAARYLKPRPGRKVIVIVSDGADTLSNADFDTTLQQVLSADCQVYVVQTGVIENANLFDLAAARRMQDLTGQSGGAVYVPKGTSDLDSAFAQISEDLAQQYVLSYYPNDERRDGRFRTIFVRITTRPNMHVRARKGYYPPKS